VLFGVDAERDSDLLEIVNAFDAGGSASSGRSVKAAKQQKEERDKCQYDYQVSPAETRPPVLLKRDAHSLPSTIRRAVRSKHLVRTIPSSTPLRLRRFNRRMIQFGICNELPGQH
jgi:hypothetical protein